MEVVLRNDYRYELRNREIKRITVIVEFNDIQLNDIRFPSPIERKDLIGYEYRYSKSFLSLLSDVKTVFSRYFENNNIETMVNKVSSSCVDYENLDIVYTKDLINNL